MKALRLLLAVPCLALGHLAAAPVAPDLALPEKIFPQLQVILDAAVQQSPRMINRALDLEIAENSRIAAQAGLLPSIYAGASYYKSEDRNAFTYPNQPTIANSYRVSKTPYSATLSQPLYHWGERRNAARIGEIQQKISQGQYREGYRLLAQELRGAYLRLIGQKLAVKRTRFYVEVTQEKLKQEEERLLQKVISGAEIAIARLTAEQAQLALERAEFDFQTAKASLARLSGQGVLADEAIPDSLPATGYAAEPYDRRLAGFLTQNDPPTTEAATLRSQLEVENLNYANARTRLRPKASVTLGLSQDQQNNLYGTIDSYTLTSIYAGISVNWTLFDGFASGAAVRSSLARRRQLENDYRQLTARLAQDAQTQVKLINFSARNMSIYDRFLSNGEGALQSVQQEFKRGVKSEADVSQAQLSLYDAQINAHNARADYLLKTGDFLGTIMEDPVLANVAAIK